MTEPADVREMFRYNRRVLDRYLRDLRRLSWKEATRDRGSGHRSLVQTYVHILDVYDAWFNYILPERMEEFERMVESGGRRKDRFRSWSDVARYDRRVWTGVADAVRRLTRRDLARRVRAPWMPGRYSVRDACLQTTFEQAHHLGEMIALYWQREREPPEMVWILNRPSPRRN